MFIAGMVVQFCKTAKDSDHRQGNDKKKNRPKQNNHLARIVQTLDSAIHRINHYPTDKY